MTGTAPPSEIYFSGSICPPKAALPPEETRRKTGARAWSYLTEPGASTGRKKSLWMATLQADLSTTRSAADSGLTSGPPGASTSNLYMEAGSLSPAELMADIDQGLYITEMMGMGVNGITGDYSRGAAGFWIDKGVLAHPISEATVAGNLKDMFAALTPANDLEFKYGTNAPTIRVEGMTVAGA